MAFMRNRNYKGRIDEEKSISNDVKILANHIGKLIFKDSLKISQKLSRINKIPFIENSFTVDLNSVKFTNGNCFGIDKLCVTYILYNCDTIQEYYKAVYSNGINSEASFENKSVRIVSGMVKGYILPDFIDDIFHELTHLFQYGMGMEKQVKLYDNVIKMLPNANDKVSESILKIIYMSFKHEQDAFTHQFYSKLMRTKDNRPFEEILKDSEYDYYKKLRATYFYGKQFNRDIVDNILGELGLNCEQFEKRMNYGASRLKSKFRNAYEKHLIDTKCHVETEIKHDIYEKQILNEYRRRYSSLDYGLESIYENN